jgi:cytochrome c-type biogenesis protein CcmE
MRGKWRLAAALLIAVLLMAVVLVDIRQAAVPFLSPSQLNESLQGQRLQVEGIVARIEQYGELLRIELTDGAAAGVTVLYRAGSQRPLTLEKGRLVVARGIYRNGVLTAERVAVRAHEE